MSSSWEAMRFGVLSYRTVIPIQSCSVFNIFLICLLPVVNNNEAVIVNYADDNFIYCAVDIIDNAVLSLQDPTNSFRWLSDSQGKKTLVIILY